MALKEIEPASAQDMVNKGEAILIDVREPKEYKELNIAAATLIPLGEVSAAKLPEASGKTIIVHCRSGKRSAMAIDRLEKSGVGNLINLRGGIMAWHKAGLPTQAG